MATFSIRRLARDDEGAWRRLFGGYVAFYRAEVAEDVIHLTFERLVAGADGMVGLVATKGSGDIVGLANLVFHRSTWSASWYCYLEDLYVDASVRGAGAGRALIEATYAEADRRGSTRVYWATQAHNATARRLYDGLATLTEFVQYRRGD